MKQPETNLTDVAAKPSKHVARAAAAVEKPAMRRLNVEVSEDQHAALKSKAAGQKKTIKEVVEQLIADYLK